MGTKQLVFCSDNNTTTLSKSTKGRVSSMQRAFSKHANLSVWSTIIHDNTHRLIRKRTVVLLTNMYLIQQKNRVFFMKLTAKCSAYNDLRRCSNIIDLQRNPVHSNSNRTDRSMQCYRWACDVLQIHVTSLINDVLGKAYLYKSTVAFQRRYLEIDLLKLRRWTFL